MRPQLLLKVPSEVTIFYNDNNITHDSILSGTISYTNISALNTSSIAAQVSLFQLGTFKNNNQNADKRRQSVGFPFLRRTPVSKEDDSKPASYRFEIVLPIDLPPTLDFPTFSVFYALVATSTLPWGQISRTCQRIRISRRPLEPIPIQPTPTAYSHSPFALCVSFDAPNPRGNELSAVLHLCGMHTHMTSTLSWEVEEIATVTASKPGRDANIDISEENRPGKPCIQCATYTPPYYRDRRHPVYNHRPARHRGSERTARRQLCAGRVVAQACAVSEDGVRAEGGAGVAD
ncbi:hypothetical protein DE146DRAFT_786172 [Phaeosphaeria sp. MPI-PUGE-AT-0046c]|nr:hypothetical protein DE146DRAFT_786172 [Phaeosphaeria sp. MPI-PUGE-AT-0046c]